MKTNDRDVVLVDCRMSTWVRKAVSVEHPDMTEEDLKRYFR